MLEIDDIGRLNRRLLSVDLCRRPEDRNGYRCSMKRAAKRRT